MNRENVATELLGLERNGLIVPSDAVKWARAHPNSALHEQLEWDDAVAGEQYRIQQVRQLIAVFVEPNHQTRQFVSLSVDRVGGGGYRNITSVMNTQNLRDILLQDALHELERMQEKYAALKELDRVWEAAKRVRPAAPPGQKRGPAPRKKR